MYCVTRIFYPNIIFLSIMFVTSCNENASFLYLYAFYQNNTLPLSHHSRHCTFQIKKKTLEDLLFLFVFSEKKRGVRLLHFSQTPERAEGAREESDCQGEDRNEE